MQQTVSPLTTKRLVKTIKVPGDKSISHRSVILGSIAQGKTEVSNFLDGEDCLCTLDAFAKMGVRNKRAQTVVIEGQGFKSLTKPNVDIYLGNSGTAMRLLTGLFAALPFEVRVTGDDSLQKRPMKRIIEPLTQMGATILSNDGKAPLLIQPTNSLHGITYNSPIASAQVKSAILLAGLNANGHTTVTEPYRSRDHLERMLQYFGAKLVITDTTISLQGGVALEALQGQKIMVPNDISSAAFFMVAAAILPNAEFLLTDVGINKTRTGILDVFSKMNVNYELLNKRIVNNEEISDIIIRSSNVKSTEISGEDLIPRLIDEIPIIAILASQAQGTTVIKNAEELKVKESNRIATTIALLKTLGVVVEETADGMVIEGRANRAFEPTLGVYDSHGDHRLAMSAAVASLVSTKPLDILQTEFVNTSFPGFFDLLSSLT